MKFKTTYGLFSYKEIDKGTEMLINEIHETTYSTCLDLGCGYGPIGITMAKINPKADVYMVDRDFVAVEYAEKNARLNKVQNTTCMLSNGFSHIKDLTFDLIASNLPYHISNEMLLWILEDAKKHMNKDGTLMIVSMNKIVPFIMRSCERLFKNYSKKTSNRMYTVSVIRKL